MVKPEFANKTAPERSTQAVEKKDSSGNVVRNSKGNIIYVPSNVQNAPQTQPSASITVTTRSGQTATLTRSPYAGNYQDYNEKGEKVGPVYRMENGIKTPVNIREPIKETKFETQKPTKVEAVKAQPTQKEISDSDTGKVNYIDIKTGKPKNIPEEKKSINKNEEMLYSYKYTPKNIKETSIPEYARSKNLKVNTPSTLSLPEKDYKKRTGQFIVSKEKGFMNAPEEFSRVAKLEKARGNLILSTAYQAGAFSTGVATGLISAVTHPFQTYLAGPVELGVNFVSNPIETTQTEIENIKSNPYGYAGRFVGSQAPIIGLNLAVNKATATTETTIEPINLKTGKTKVKTTTLYQTNEIIPDTKGISKNYVNRYYTGDIIESMKAYNVDKANLMKTRLTNTLKELKTQEAGKIKELRELRKIKKETPGDLISNLEAAKLNAKANLIEEAQTFKTKEAPATTQLREARLIKKQTPSNLITNLEVMNLNIKAEAIQYRAKLKNTLLNLKTQKAGKIKELRELRKIKKETPGDLISNLEAAKLNAKANIIENVKEITIEVKKPKRINQFVKKEIKVEPENKPIENVAPKQITIIETEKPTIIKQIQEVKLKKPTKQQRQLYKQTIKPKIEREYQKPNYLNKSSIVENPKVSQKITLLAIQKQEIRQNKIPISERIQNKVFSKVASLSRNEFQAATRSKKESEFLNNQNKEILEPIKEIKREIIKENDIKQINEIKTISENIPEYKQTPNIISINEPDSISKSKPKLNTKMFTENTFTRQQSTPVFLPNYNKQKKKKTKKSLFAVQVRRKGKFKTVGFFNTKAAALNVGKTNVENTAAASFRIKDIESNNYIKNGITSNRFYQNKKEPSVFIQKRSYRIGTPGEKREITYKGIMINKSKSIKKKNIWGF